MQHIFPNRMNPFLNVRELIVACDAGGAGAGARVELPPCLLVLRACSCHLLPEGHRRLCPQGRACEANADAPSDSDSDSEWRPPAAPPAPPPAE